MFYDTCFYILLVLSAMVYLLAVPSVNVMIEGHNMVVTIRDWAMNTFSFKNML